MRAKKTKVPQATAKRTPPPDEPYTNIEMRLVCASKIKIVNGEHAGTVINWDSDMLRLYLYMFNQVKGFESRHGEFYQSQDRIKLSVGLGKTKLNELLDALKMLGLIRKTGEKKVKGAPRGLIKYTAVRLMEVIGNLEIIFAEDDGEPVWDHERASGNAAKKSEEKQENGNGHEEAETPQAEQAAATATLSTDAPANQPAGQNPGMAPEPVPDASAQRSGAESDDDRTDGNNSGNLEVQIFDDRGVITEAFINNLNSLTGYDEPRRNDDGTLQSFRYVYGIAQQTQDKRDGVTVRPLDGYMAEAQPWHIPPHLLSTPIPIPETEYEEDPNF